MPNSCVPRPVLFKYSALEIMAVNERQHKSLFFGAIKAWHFDERRRLVANQLLNATGNILQTHVPALKPIIRELADYFKIKELHFPDKLTILWYTGFLAKHIHALDLPDSRTYPASQQIAKFSDLEFLGSCCGYYNLIGMRRSHLSHIKHNLLGFFQLYNISVYNRRSTVALTIVLPNVKYMGMALLIEAFCNMQNLIALPYINRKNEEEGIFEFITHDFGHDLPWKIRMLNDKHMLLQNQLYSLVSRYLILHILRYPEMEVFRQALVALFLIVHEDDCVAMRDEFLHTGKLYPDNLRDAKDFHRNIFARNLEDLINGRLAFSQLVSYFSYGSGYHLEIYEMFKIVGLKVNGYNFSSCANDEKNYKYLAYIFLREIIERVDQAFAAFNDVAEHVLASGTPDGETLSTKFARCASRL